MTKRSLTLTIIGVVTMILLVSFIGCKRINAGYVGIKVKNIGGDRGVSNIEYVTGWQFYLKAASKIYEFPVKQQHVEYDAFAVPAKGGTVFTVHPSFNYAINPGEVANMFQNLGQTINTLERGFIYNALRIALREATNTFTVDSILNNVSYYDNEVTERLNHQLKPYFTVSQFTSGLEPDEGLKKAIMEKAEAIQRAITIENQQKAIRAKAENEIIEAKKDSTVKVVNAQAAAKEISLMQEQLSKSPQYVELIKAQRWKGDVPQTVLGGNSPILFNLGTRQ